MLLAFVLYCLDKIYQGEHEHKYHEYADEGVRFACGYLTAPVISPSLGCTVSPVCLHVTSDLPDGCVTLRAAQVAPYSNLHTELSLHPFTVWCHLVRSASTRVVQPGMSLLLIYFLLIFFFFFFYTAIGDLHIYFPVIYICGVFFYFVFFC